jgi:hypothetical protein
VVTGVFRRLRRIWRSCGIPDDTSRALEPLNRS